MIKIGYNDVVDIEMDARVLRVNTMITHGKSRLYLIKDLFELTNMLLITYLDETQLKEQRKECGLISHDSY